MLLYFWLNQHQVLSLMPDLSCLQAFHSWDKSDFDLGGKTAGLVEMTCKDCLIRDLLYLFLTTSLWIPYPVVVQVNLRLCAIGAFLGIFMQSWRWVWFFFCAAWRLLSCQSSVFLLCWNRISVRLSRVQLFILNISMHRHVSCHSHACIHSPSPMENEFQCTASSSSQLLTKTSAP